MLECTYIGTRTDKRIDIEALTKVLIGLSAGALLGLIVALPYDRLLGLPDSTGTILGAAVWAALLGVLHVGRMRGAVAWKVDLCGPTGENHPGSGSKMEHAR